MACPLERRERRSARVCVYEEEESARYRYIVGWVPG